jgi:IS1 family transposase
MNRLSTETRGQVVGLLTEGMSMRAISRVTGVARNTIDKLLIDLGTACAEYQDGVLTNLDTTRLEVDEIWAFCYSKQKNVPEEHHDTFGYGDVWTWTAIDADTKLIPTWLVGERTLPDCYAFIADLRSRLKGRVQITTDGLNVYVSVIDSLMRDRVDYAALHKLYGGTSETEQRRCSPAECTGIDKRIIMGKPNERLISTSYVERQNLTMRMGMRRFTRLTNAFSRKVDNHAHAVALHFMNYNFARPHQTLGKRVTPAMAAGIERHPWSLTDIAELLD